MLSAHFRQAVEGFQYLTQGVLRSLMGRFLRSESFETPFDCPTTPNSPSISVKVRLLHVPELRDRARAKRGLLCDERTGFRSSKHRGPRARLRMCHSKFCGTR